MKKTISIILSLLILLSLAVPLLAEDDAPVNYVIDLTVTAPENGERYEIGEKITVTTTVRNIAGAQTPPIYGLGGILNFDAFILEFAGVNFYDALTDGINYKNDVEADRIAFSYLCPTAGGELIGTDVNAGFKLAEFKFEVKSSGTVDISLSDMVITNKDASARYISANDTVLKLTTGTGVNESSAETLEKLIKKAEHELNSAVMGDTIHMVYPAFTVSDSVYKAFEDAIKEAKAALCTASSASDFEAAERALSSAIYVYNASKRYGRDPSDDLPGIISGVIIDKENNKDKENGNGNETNFIEVTATAGEHGSLAAGSDIQLVRYGTSVSVQAVPDDGYEIEKVLVNGEEYTAENNTITIASVTNKVFVQFSFMKKPRFTDVARGTWYFDAVEAITEMGLFTGTSETEFSPDTDMSRAMLVTVLHRLEGKPAVDAKPTFKDVASDTWYTDAVAWASANGIVTGYNEDTFGTNDSATRQDMVTILYRYYKYKGMVKESNFAFDAYTDASDISDYAKEAMTWACGLGLIKGTSETTLTPKANSSRAQVATVILRCTENIH